MSVRWVATEDAAGGQGRTMCTAAEVRAARGAERRNVSFLDRLAWQRRSLAWRAQTQDRLKQWRGGGSKGTSNRAETRRGETQPDGTKGNARWNGDAWAQ